MIPMVFRWPERRRLNPTTFCDELLLPIISTNEIGLWKLVLEIGLDDGVTALTQLGIPRNV
jgi:hypothetical protein